MLFVDVSPETGLFRVLPNHVFRVPNVGNKKAVMVIFVSKRSKFQLEFNKGAENGEKIFCF